MAKHLICLLLFVSASCNHKTAETETPEATTDTTITRDILSLEPFQEESVTKDACECRPQKFEKHLFRADIVFNNNYPGKLDLDTLQYWVNNPDRLKIRSIELIGFDTIPEEMGIFENVEELEIRMGMRPSVVGLGHFPKLKFLNAEECYFFVDSSSVWLSNLEVLVAIKSKIIGLESFGQMKHMRELRLSYSGIEPLPSCFEKMKCLEHFVLGVPISKVDLNQFDFTEMSCLDFVQILSWNNLITGIPKGVSSVEIVKISHPSLTQEEKERLRSRQSP
jgi:hypothetical protein